MDDKVWIYVGHGAFIDGVPARDLTAGDMARLDEFQRAAVEAASIYRRAPRRAPEPQTSKPEKDEGQDAKAAPAKDKE